MFNILVPIQKAQTKGHTLTIEGIASSPTIDSHEERFAPSAIEKMRSCVEKNEIPIRVEHANLVFTDIGVWTKAEVLEGNKLYVKGEIDTRLSLGNDMRILVEKGKQLCLSVGGRVVDASYELVESLGKSVRTFKDVILDEISVVKYPANPDAIVTMAKSVDWGRVEQGAFACSAESSLLEVNRSGMKKVAPDEFKDNDWLAQFRRDGVFGEDEELNQMGLDLIKAMGSCSGKDKKKMTYKDMGELVESVLKDDSVDSDSSPYSRLTAEDMSVLTKLLTVMAQVELPESGVRPAILDDPKYWDNLSEEMQVVLFNRWMCCPHHNLDYSVNEELVLYWLKRVIDDQKFYSPRDFAAILEHLYRHLKELELVKSSSVTPIINNPDSHMEPQKVQKNGGTDTADTPVVDAPVETPVETPAAPVETPETPEVPAETPATPDAPVETPTPEAAPETPAATPETPETPAPSAEQPTGEPVEKGMGEFITKSQFEGFEKSLGQLVGVVQEMAKSVAKIEPLQKAWDEVTTKVLEPMVKTLDQMSKASMGRKSHAVNFQEIEKTMQSSHSVDPSVEKATTENKEGTFEEVYRTVLQNRQG